MLKKLVTMGFEPGTKMYLACTFTNKATDITGQRSAIINMPFKSMTDKQTQTDKKLNIFTPPAVCKV